MQLTLLALAVALQAPPNFAGTIVTPKMGQRSGPLNLAVILWDPGRADHLAPSKEQIGSLIFGKERSVAGWWRENSGSRSSLQESAVLGWYKSDYPAPHYWRPEAEDKGRNGFLNGHTEKWAEAIRKAEKDFDFAKYDRNRNRILEPTELGILFVIPQNNPFGTMRTPAGREVPTWEPLTVDGVTIPAITEAYVGNPPNLGLVAHELSHLFLGAPDMYVDAPHRAGALSIMDVSYRSVHLGPFEKLKLGWLRTRLLTKPGEYELKDVETSNEAIVLYDPASNGREYFLIENRWRGRSYDAGGIPADGLAVWQILEDPADFRRGAPHESTAGDWGRWGVRLLRPGLNASVADRGAFLSKGDSIEWSFVATLGSWSIVVLSDPGPRIKFKLRRLNTKNFLPREIGVESSWL